MCRKLTYLTFLILVLALVAGTQAGIEGHWEFDEGSGSTAADSSDNGRDGTISGATWASPGWDGTGSCLDFDGQGTNRVSLGTFDVPGNAISLACWFKADNLDTPGNDPRMISKAIGGNNDEHWFMISSSRQGSIKVLRFRLKTDGSTGEIKANTATGNIELDVWTHVAVTWDGSTMRIYKNGEEVGSLAKGGTLSTDATVKVAIGNQPEGTGDRPFDGLIDEVLVCDRAMSAVQVQDLVNGILPDWQKASEPVPADGAIHEEMYVTLQWLAGDDVVSHDVYLGD
ncbi:MAG: LamG domain-containing protein, partial [Phycisphaerales bacterium]